MQVLPLEQPTTPTNTSKDAPLQVRHILTRAGPVVSPPILLSVQCKPPIVPPTTQTTNLSDALLTCRKCWKRTVSGASEFCSICRSNLPEYKQRKVEYEKKRKRTEEARNKRAKQLREKYAIKKAKLAESRELVDSQIPEAEHERERLRLLREAEREVMARIEKEEQEADICTFLKEKGLLADGRKLTMDAMRVYLAFCKARDPTVHFPGKRDDMLQMVRRQMLKTAGAAEATEIAALKSVKQEGSLPRSNERIELGGEDL